MTTKFTADVVHKLLGVREAQQAPAALMKIVMDQQKRNELFKQFLDVSTDVSHDWFSQYFMSVQADRKDKKQDFTPESISKLVNMLVGSNDSSEYYEVAAGTGSMMIQRWQQDRLKHKPWDYRPSMYFYHLEELGDSTLPFLIFNCAIRGMNATIVHGDSLTRAARQVYFIQNDEDDYLHFSTVNVMPHSKDVEQEFDIRQWLEPEQNHIESTEIPARYNEVIKKLAAGKEDKLEEK
ncbi:MAG: N-6 DNA methylase [Lacticaseibacillus paracasei]